MVVQLLHRCFQIFAQLLTKLVPKSTRHSLAVADSPRVGRAAKPDDFSDLRGDLIQLLFRKASKAAVEKLNLPGKGSFAKTSFQDEPPHRIGHDAKTQAVLR